MVESPKVTNIGKPIFRCITHTVNIQLCGALWLLHSHYQLLGRHNHFVATFEVSNVISENWMGRVVPYIQFA